DNGNVLRNYDYHPRLNCELKLSVFCRVVWFEAIPCYVVSSNQCKLKFLAHSGQVLLKV
ncbi:hypothetical protein L195_g060054, partial [Trifolium pratense]